MSKNRKKKYKKKVANIPLTSGWVDLLSREMRFGVMVIDSGFLNENSFDRIASVMNVISVAAHTKKMQHYPEMRVVEGAVRTMNIIAQRQESCGVWDMRSEERASVLAGIIKCEEILPKLTVRELAEAYALISGYCSFGQAWPRHF